MDKSPCRCRAPNHFVYFIKGHAETKGWCHPTLSGSSPFGVGLIFSSSVPGKLKQIFLCFFGRRKVWQEKLTRDVQVWTFQKYWTYWNTPPAMDDLFRLTSPERFTQNTSQGRRPLIVFVHCSEIHSDKSLSGSNIPFSSAVRGHCQTCEEYLKIRIGAYRCLNRYHSLLWINLLCSLGPLGVMKCIRRHSKGSLEANLRRERNVDFGK